MGLGFCCADGGRGGRSGWRVGIGQGLAGRLHVGGVI